MEKPRRQRQGALLWGFAAVLTVSTLACIAVSWPRSFGGEQAVLMSSAQEKFLDKLNNILLKKTNKKMLSAENSILKSQEDARAPRGRRKNQFSKKQLAANACADGGPCNGVGVGPKPKMVYQPSTGNWVVENAGNPDWIWQHLMQHARQRDQAGLGERPPPHAAHIRKQTQTPFVQNKAPEQMLAQLDDTTSDAETNRQTLVLKLKSLLREKEVAGEPEQPKPAKAMMAVAAAKDFKAEGTGVSAKVARLKEEISRGNYLGRVGDLADKSEMEVLYEELSKTKVLSEICQRRHLAQDGLDVLKGESLSGCEREIRAQMNEARRSLSAGFHRLRAAEARLVFPKAGSLPQLRAKKQKLAAELSSMEKQHDELRHELSQQKEAIGKLVAKGALTQLTQSHSRSPAPPQEAMDAASDFLGAARSPAAATPLADALMGRTRKARTTPQRSAAARRHAPTSRPFSPPVPAGLPPGYTGSLALKGSSDVPDVPPPGTPA